MMSKNNPKVRKQKNFKKSQYIIFMAFLVILTINNDSLHQFIAGTYYSNLFIIIYNRMQIIEGYKRKARESLSNVMASLQYNDQQATTQEQEIIKKQLIQQLDSSPQQQDRYEQQQFTFFAQIPKQKRMKCVVCKHPSPKYTCPKCKVRYCSTEHYKSHNLFCTERFYRGEVQALMKRTKAGCSQRKKIVEMLKLHDQQQLENEAQVMRQTKLQQVSETRLQQIINALDEGREVVLSQNERKCFQRYLKEIEEYSLSQEQFGQKKIENISAQQQTTLQSQLFDQQIPFWTVDEGLDQYFLMNQPIQIQSFNKSSNKILIQYRHQTSPILRETLSSLAKSISFKKTSIFVVYDLLQVIYLECLLFRSYNGDYLNNPQLAQSFIQLYQEDLARNIAQSQPKVWSQMVLHELPIVLPIIKTKISQIQSNFIQVLKGWLPFIVQDSIKVFNNRYICLQAVYRLLESFRNKSKTSSKKETNTYLKIIKKLQFLLVFVSEIVYASLQSSSKLPETFMQTNILKLIQTITQKDKQLQLAQSSAIKAMRDQQTRLKQLKINKILIP